METVTNAATTAANTVVNTATNLIYGTGTAPSQQSGTEPRSGETGADDQPYDAGNLDGVPGNPGQNASSTTATTGSTLGSTTDSSLGNTSGGIPASTTDDKSTSNTTSGVLGGNTSNNASSNASSNTPGGTLGATNDSTLGHVTESTLALGNDTDKPFASAVGNTSSGATGDFGSSSGDIYSRSHSSNLNTSSSGSSTFASGPTNSPGPASSNVDSGPTTSSAVPGSHSTTAGTNPRSDTATSAVDGPGALDTQKGNTADRTAGGFSTAASSVSADPSSGQQLEAKHQGANRPQEEPTGGVGNTSPTPAKSPEDEERERGQRAIKNRSPDDHSGEPLTMHDDAHDTEMRKTNRSKSLSQEGGGELGKEKGTGEQYVKSTGLAVDGGNFDATAPGAGKEADRLLEAKGIHKTDSNKGAPQDLSGGDPHEDDTREKTSKMHKLKEKLQEKLHISS